MNWTHDVWHWPQYYAITIFFIGLLAWAINVTTAESAASRAGQVFLLVALVFGQFALYCGGFY